MWLLTLSWVKNQAPKDAHALDHLSVVVRTLFPCAFLRRAYSILQKVWMGVFMLLQLVSLAVRVVRYAPPILQGRA